MKDRIRQIMESQHMTQQVFAQFIEMSPASLSSIFNGRTKPTLNIVEAIRKKIPDISIDWLMFGSGPMYLSSEPAHQESSEGGTLVQKPVINNDLFSSPSPSSATQPSEIAPHPVTVINSVKNTHSSPLRDETKIIDKPQRRVTEIRVFYDDQTWESFVPAKK
jgi:transcriptional regulator with XRE-family HTH domain